MGINFPEGQQDGPFDGNFAGDYGNAVAISTFSTWTDIGLQTGDITIKDQTSIIMYWGSLSTEVDGASTGHGVCRVRYSTDSGSNWTTHYPYNMTGSNDNSIGNGFAGYMDHDLAAGTTFRLKCDYRCNGSSGNQTVADTGPGFAPLTRLFLLEVNS